MTSPKVGSGGADPSPLFDRTMRYGEGPEVSDTLRAPPPVMGEDKTLPSGQGGLTVAADRSILEPPARATGGGRTTILPRVAFEDQEHRLVLNERARFEVQRALGEGGAGEVLAAIDNDIDRPVALKRMRGELRSPEALARFAEEIRTIGRLEHPNIVPIHDVGVDEEGQYYFVMKYVDGETLEAIIERLREGDGETHRRYPFEARVQLFRGLLEAVAFAHSKGIVHRDIKPSNVMVGPFGEVLLMDWGIAKPLGDGTSGLADTLLAGAGAREGGSERVFKTQVGAVVGTPMYMSPEQARGAAVDERSDVYSLSVLFHELLGLRHYLEGRQSLAEVMEGVLNELPSIASTARSVHQPPVPMDLVWYLRQGLQKDPALRYASVAEMIARLDRRAEGDIPIQCHITFVKSVTRGWLRFVDRHPIVTTVLLLSAIGGAVTLAIRALA